MGIELEMMRLQNHAKRDEAVKEALLKTQEDKDPYNAFCKKAQELGYDITLYELADMGQAFCDTMMRSVNGGGRGNFEIWTEFYEMFFEAIK